MNQDNLEELKELLFASDNRACFLERERVLQELAVEMDPYQKPDRYAKIFAKLLSRVSTPVLDCDFFVGRVVEGPPDAGMTPPNNLLFASGHMSFHYEKILLLGLRGILEEIERNAAELGDEASREFARNARIVTEALRAFALRYAGAARKKGKLRAAEALEQVPFEPAYDFFSALQGIWLIHLVASCYVGERDYAFGKMDGYLFPFYQKAIEDGIPQEELVEMLAFFFLKTNEICGRGTHNYMQKPVPCQASKQYVILGGNSPNELSFLILDAAERNHMAQPEFTVLYRPDGDEAFARHVASAMTRLTDKLQVYHYDLIYRYLRQKGFPEEVASDFTFSACCTFDLHYHTVRREAYLPTISLFWEALHAGSFSSLEEVVSAFSAKLRDWLTTYLIPECAARPLDYNRKTFVLDSLLIGECAQRCRYPEDGGLRYHVFNVFFPGMATIGDSLAAIDQLVFRTGQFSYESFLEIVDRNFEGAEQLRQTCCRLVKFGNDTEWDAYTVLGTNAMLDALESVELPSDWYAIPGFYSLERDNSWAASLPATPDGRLAGTPFSENQSPVYGGDRNGVTALLNSLSKIPFFRTATGGLNLTFSQQLSPEIMKTLLDTYFRQGGLHVGISVLNRETLQDAMRHPERYRSLTVRLYGFSEYFISLPEWQQQAVLNRTVY